MGALNQALNLYKDINSKHPDNIECLKFLVQISKEMGLGYEMYA
jgi:intraflagellar transport protein 88